MNGNDRSETATGSEVGSYGPVAVATVTIALTTWPIAFNLGAYQAVFYDDIFKTVVAATVGLAIVVFRPPYERKKLWFVRTALASPALWLTLAVVVFGSTATAASDPLFGTLGLLVALISVPTVLKLLIDLFMPDMASLQDTTMLGLVVAVVIVVAAAGYTVGANNDAFLTCDDFKIAGSDQPSNCAQP
jgi:hypothetical protein